MRADTHPLAPMLRKLEVWRPLGSAERAALLALPHHVVALGRSQYIVREGDRTTHSCLLISGFAFRQKQTRSGGRSIIAIHMSGDIVDLQNSLLVVADHNVQALNQATVAFIPREAIIELTMRHPQTGLLLWYDTLVDGSISREWILNIARRDGRARIAHIICEFGVRLESMGLGTRTKYDFPLTQEQLADSAGLHTVHVNRILKELERNSLISYERGAITVVDWAKLVKAGDFNDTYLHQGPLDLAPGGG